MKRPKSTTALLLIGLVILAIAVSACTPKVPNVVGMTYDQAVKTLQDAGYKISETRYGYTSAIAPSTVATQSPAGGTALRRGGDVKLFVVLPLGTLETPNLVGLTKAAAESALSTLSLSPSPTEDYSATIAKGIVISQAPTAGAPINPGDTVAFVVSKGPVPPKTKVPAVTGQTQADAETALKNVGLTPSASQAYSDTVAKGIVISQSPAAGSEVDPGAKVSFAVSLGKGTQAVTVPNVVGKSQKDAETALKNAGFAVSVVTQTSSSVPAGIVSGQSPPAGSTTAKGTVIAIVVSTGADPTVSVPNVVGMTADEAAAAISAVGLVPQVVEQHSAEIPKGTVISQNPTSGVKADKGTTVLITVSSGVPPAPPAPTTLPAP